MMFTILSVHNFGFIYYTNSKNGYETPKVSSHVPVLIIIFRMWELTHRDTANIKSIIKLLLYFRKDVLVDFFTGCCSSGVLSGNGGVNSYNL